MIMAYVHHKHLLNFKTVFPKANYTILYYEPCLCHSCLSFALCTYFVFLFISLLVCAIALHGCCHFSFISRSVEFICVYVTHTNINIARSLIQRSKEFSQWCLSCVLCVVCDSLRIFPIISSGVFETVEQMQQMISQIILFWPKCHAISMHKHFVNIRDFACREKDPKIAKNRRESIHSLKILLWKVASVRVCM